MKRNIELVLAYDGSGFKGWQVQPDVRTVQGVLNRKLEKLLAEPIKTMGASRTDSGVHAHDQHVTFKIENAIPLVKLARALNHHLPEDVKLVHALEREEGYCARRSARAKHYVYIIKQGEQKNPFLGRYVWSIERDLDFSAMVAAARCFSGINDFKSLQCVRDFRSRSVVQIFTSRLEENHGHLCFHVVGRSFLYNMVRNMVGALIKVGVGDWNVAQFKMNLFSGDRSQMGVTAPAHGLHLLRVFYDRESYPLDEGKAILNRHFELLD
ncbi:MAG: tRNA pseudouridine(38-40) synthase TruA [Acidobacteria bacterium]|nr:MAG: tRNA pseudouridine(38-40) synthase TruA [Acidobacteriota bacterium]